VNDPFVAVNPSLNQLGEMRNGGLHVSAPLPSVKVHAGPSAGQRKAARS
jgi:hypothetical protein